ncbi:hypothetical protein [Mycoplasmopsis lipofaciens]|uniref:hypothetical protein n=1 Tax=Mycoplasmopsis lipofaciens TaxID=114884 RepID=UPI000484B0A7|nr:hypothetical protein [Mycoplasmopsis lipofaciens]
MIKIICSKCNYEMIFEPKINHLSNIEKESEIDKKIECKECTELKKQWTINFQKFVNSTNEKERKEIEKWEKNVFWNHRVKIHGEISAYDNKRYGYQKSLTKKIKTKEK